MRARHLASSVLVLAACGVSACSASRPPEPEAPVKPLISGSDLAGEEPVPQKEEPPCASGGSVCYARAESELDSSKDRGERLLAACSTCEDAPPAAFRLLATMREERGAKGEARETLRLGLSRHPASDLLWLALARLEMAAGKYREALSAYASAERLRPGDDALANEYQSALERVGTDDERRASEVTHLLLEAAGRAEMDDLKGAESALKNARERAGRVPRLIAMVDLRIAMLLVRRGEHTRALSLLESVLKNGAIDPSTLAETHVASSEVLLSLKRPKDAIRAAEQAIALEPRNVLAHANLGVAFAAAGEKERAMAALKKACELGLPRRLTYQEFMAIGPAIESLKTHPDFEPMVRAAWPRSSKR